MKTKLLQVRSNKAEEEVAELMKKSTQLEVELDKTKEQLVMMTMLMWILINFCQVTTTQKLDDKEKALLAAEMEVNTLNRKVFPQMISPPVFRIHPS